MAIKQQHTPGPWTLCRHLESLEADKACSCGYRGVIYGPEHDVAFAVCQPGHEPAPKGQEGSEPARYPRDVELANARLIAAAPELLEALEAARIALIAVADSAVEAGFDQLADIIDDQLGKANRAITKARGEAL